jgi:hypothetical protein
MQGRVLASLSASLARKTSTSNSRWTQALKSRKRSASRAAACPGPCGSRKTLGAATTRRLTLRVFSRNTAARAFYERHGFDQLDENDGSRNEENKSDVTYTWSGRG